jgi:xanthine dehydrogenase YagS FAD-binding subunit
MSPFTYVRPTSVEAAVLAASSADSVFIGGGTNLVDLMKEGVEAPRQLVDVRRLGLDRIELRAEGLRLGAAASNAATAEHRAVRQRYPLVAQAILAGASGQLRNAATNGGNLRQRTRCPYFYDVAQPCNKRVPNSGCGAAAGHHRTHAIFGASTACIATYPGDMAQALHALDAVISIAGPRGVRQVPVTEFHRLPSERPERDADIEPGELVTSIDLSTDVQRFAARSTYLKVRDRASYAFALVSIAAALDLDGDRVREARLCLGGVAHKPWRARAAEDLLRGQRVDAALLQRAADAAVQGASPLPQNRYKVELARRLVVRAVGSLTGVRT